MRHIVRGQHAGVDAFVDEDARIVTKPPVELSAADVDGDDARRPAAQEDIGETAGRCADVERPASRRIDAECVERARQLHAAAADVRVIRRRQLDTRIGSDSGAGLGNDLAVDGHLAGQNQRACPFA